MIVKNLNYGLRTNISLRKKKLFSNPKQKLETKLQKFIQKFTQIDVSIMSFLTITHSPWTGVTSTFH